MPVRLGGRYDRDPATGITRRIENIQGDQPDGKDAPDTANAPADTVADPVPASFDDSEA